MRFILALLLPLTVASHVLAASESHVVKKRVLANRYIKFPSTIQVFAAMVPGYYAITVPGEEFPSLVDESVTRIKIGVESPNGSGIYALAPPNFSKNQLSHERANELRTQALQALDKSRLIRVTYGSGTKHIIMVSAFDCPACVTLEKRLDGLRDKLSVTVYVIPIVLHPSPEKERNIKAIWCSDDSAKAWRDAMLYQRFPASQASSCALQLRDSVATALLLDGVSTPTAYAADGRPIRGMSAMSSKELMQLFGG